MNNLEKTIALEVRAAFKVNKEPDLTLLLEEIRDSVIKHTLICTHGNQSKSARVLGMNRRTVKSIYLSSQDKRLRTDIGDYIAIAN